MSEVDMYVAKPIVENTFWIVEENGSKVGTLQRSDNAINLRLLVPRSESIRFKTLEELEQKYDLKFAKPDEAVAEAAEEVTDIRGYPLNINPVYNSVFDVTRNLPIYTKTETSSSYFCAGYYILGFAKGWQPAFCPKLSTLEANPYKGPFTTKEEMKKHLAKARRGE